MSGNRTGIDDPHSRLRSNVKPLRLLPTNSLVKIEIMTTGQDSEALCFAAEELRSRPGVSKRPHESQPVLATADAFQPDTVLHVAVTGRS